MRQFSKSTSIGDLLLRYKTLLRAPQGVVVRAVALEYTRIGIPCDESSFSYSVANRTISLKVTGPKRSEMLLRKSEVLDALRTTLSDKDVPQDIV